MVAAWFAGPGPGVFATGVGALLGNHFFLRAIGEPGIEVSPAFLPRLFEGFQQDLRTASPTSHGLGLGLSIARHFAERYGGTIRADSEGPGRGATFTIVLPVRQPPARTADPHAAEVSGARPPVG